MWFVSVAVSWICHCAPLLGPCTVEVCLLSDFVFYSLHCSARKTHWSSSLLVCVPQYHHRFFLCLAARRVWIDHLPTHANLPTAARTLSVLLCDSQGCLCCGLGCFLHVLNDMVSGKLGTGLLATVWPVPVVNHLVEKHSRRSCRRLCPCQCRSTRDKVEAAAAGGVGNTNNAYVLVQAE